MNSFHFQCKNGTSTSCHSGSGACSATDRARWLSTWRLLASCSAAGSESTAQVQGCRSIVWGWPGPEGIAMNDEDIDAVYEDYAVQCFLSQSFSWRPLEDAASAVRLGRYDEDLCRVNLRFWRASAGAHIVHATTPAQNLNDSQGIQRRIPGCSEPKGICLRNQWVRKEHLNEI